MGAVGSLVEFPRDFHFACRLGGDFGECLQGKVDGVLVRTIGTFANDGCGDALMIREVGDGNLLSTVTGDKELVVEFNDNVGVLVDMTAGTGLALLVIPSCEATGNDAAGGLRRRGCGFSWFLFAGVVFFDYRGSAHGGETGCGFALWQGIAASVEEGGVVVFILAVKAFISCVIHAVFLKSGGPVGRGRANKERVIKRESEDGESGKGEEKGSDSVHDSGVERVGGKRDVKNEG